jgi:hypothetical protein
MRSWLCLLISWSSACRQHTVPIADGTSIPVVHDFDLFYTRFHSDSTFQMNHILFPLEGVPESSDTMRYENGFRWETTDWVLHHAFNPHDTAFHRQFSLLDSSLVIEKIYHKMSSMRLERRFAFNEEWKLIYYAPLRMPVSIEIK